MNSTCVLYRTIKQLPTLSHGYKSEIIWFHSAVLPAARTAKDWSPFKFSLNCETANKFRSEDLRDLNLRLAWEKCGRTFWCQREVEKQHVNQVAAVTMTTCRELQSSQQESKVWITFSRSWSIDFGYSLQSEETTEIWQRPRILDIMIEELWWPHFGLQLVKII